MTQDELEFLIVQHIDGTLSAEETPRLAAILSSDASARALLDEHERLARHLRASPAASVDGEWLSAQIASRIDEAAEAEASRSLKLPSWSLLGGALAAAAALAISFTAGVAYRGGSVGVAAQQPAAQQPTEQPTRTVVASVSAPTPERASQPREMSVTVGAPTNLSPSLVTALFLAEQFPSQGRVIVRPAGVAAERPAFD